MGMCVPEPGGAHARRGAAHQRTRSWKWSPDPEFQAKAEQVLGLYRDAPEDWVVVCFDEMGPIQLIPHQGSGWAQHKRPERLRATYSKNGGVRYLFGAYDVHADWLHGRLRPHKSAQEVLGFYRQIRIRYKLLDRRTGALTAGGLMGARAGTSSRRSSASAAAAAASASARACGSASIASARASG